MSNTNYLINLCYDLQLKGKTPTVALIRSSASMPLPIPEVIKAIKHFKANPGQRPSPSMDESKEKQVTPQSLEQRVNQLEQQLLSIINEVTLLKSKVK
ncbi:MAG: hypothetical protein ABJH06_08635 [Paraglaciecola sp.]|uniref:hypothetical protein n=1 Tax=Paraglaciecola sp. TaxID=1920173 RepID=UPI003266833E